LGVVNLGTRTLFLQMSTKIFIAPPSRLPNESAIFKCNIGVLNRAESILPSVALVKAVKSNLNHLMLLYCYVIQTICCGQKNCN
jgi:hypothetical protein